MDERLKKIINESGLTQQKLSELTGIKRSYIGMLACGKRTPKKETIIKILHAIGKKEDDYFLEDNESKLLTILKRENIKTPEELETIITLYKQIKTTLLIQK
ncbi:MAG: helix-turn-helix transcriptional regulator [Desulfobacterales bacterium]|nr:helix-turn-helix transcriptional regulator [Desulfobacterales bacterium]